MGKQDIVLHHHGLWFVAVVFSEFNAAQHHTISSHLQMNVWLCSEGACVILELAADVRLQHCFLFTALDTTGSLVLFSLFVIVNDFFLPRLLQSVSAKVPNACKVTCS